MRACLKVYSTWPAMLDVGRIDTSPRRSSAIIGPPTSGEPTATATGSSQKIRPTTAASRRTRRSPSGSASMRAARRPWIVSGMIISPASPVDAQWPSVRATVPASMRRWTISSTNRGLPSAVSTMRSCNSAGRSCAGRRSASMVRLWSTVSGRNATTAASPPPTANVGCVSANSGRAVATRRIGPVARASTRSTISTSPSLAQWRSSITTTTGRRLARAEMNCGQRRLSSVTTATGRLRSSGLPGMAMPAVVASANTIASRSASGSAAGATRSAIPARRRSCAAVALLSRDRAQAERTISASGQKAMPIPAAGQRPRSRSRSGRSDSAVPRASRTSRLLPMPADPYTTASLGERVSMASSSNPARTASSRSRPTTPARMSRSGPDSMAPWIAPMSGWAVTSLALPLSESVTESPKRKSDRVAWYVRSPTRTWFGAAAVCSRAATLIASPVTIARSGWTSLGTTTSPVLTPMRMARATPWRASISRPRSANRATISAAALTARAASSSRTRGTPKIATAASPMYFSMLPPQAATVAATSEK